MRRHDVDATAAAAVEAEVPQKPQLADVWKAWSQEKKGFFMDLMLSMYIDRDGVLRRDPDAARELLVAQVQKIKEAQEAVIGVRDAANFIIANALQADGQTLKPSNQIEDELKVLVSERGPAAFMIFMSGLGGKKDPIPPKASVCHSLVGGFKPFEKTPAEFYQQTVNTKMFESEGEKWGMDTTQLPQELSEPPLVPLGQIYDVSFAATRWAPPLSELEFLLDQREFKRKIREKAGQLAKDMYEEQGMSKEIQEEIQDKITNLLSQLSEQEERGNLISLLSLSIARVERYVACYTDQEFEQFVKATEKNLIIPNNGSDAFTANSKKLFDLIQEGALAHTYPPEAVNYMKLFLLLLNQPANQTVNVLEKVARNFTCLNTFSESWLKMTRTQIGNLLEKTVLPTPPYNMGSTWDVNRTPEAVWEDIRAMQFFNFATLGAMAGFVSENAHLAFGFTGTEATDELQEKVDKLVDSQTPDEYIAVVKRCLTRDGRDLELNEQEKGLLEKRWQRFGVRLTRKPSERAANEQQFSVSGAVSALAAGMGTFKSVPQTVRKEPAAAAASAEPSQAASSRSRRRSRF